MREQGNRNFAAISICVPRRRGAHKRLDAARARGKMMCVISIAHPGALQASIREEKVRRRVLSFILISAFLLFLCVRPISAARVELEDGRKIVGEIVSQDAKNVVIKTRSGINLTLARDKIEHIVTDAEIEKEYAEKRAAIPKDDAKRHLELAEWCEKNGLAEHYRKELETVLSIEPENAEAKLRLDALDGKKPETPPQPAGRETGGKAAEPPAKNETNNKPAAQAAKSDKPQTSEEIEKKSETIKKQIGKGGSDKKPSKTRDALVKALDKLAANQDADGGFKEQKGANSPGRDAVVTACACLAFLATGSTLDEGPYRENLKRAVEWMMKDMMNTSNDQQPPAGNAQKCNWSRENWRLSFGGIFLLEIYAKHGDKVPGLKDKIQAAVTKLQNNLESSGGYAHGPGGPNDHGYIELGVMSNWALTMIGMAKKEGFKVNAEKMKVGLEYIINISSGGAMRYSHANPTGACAGRNGSAMLALAVCGQKNSETFAALANFMLKHMSEMKYGHASPSMHYLGGALGAVQHSKQAWDLFVAAHFSEIIGAQQPDGSFRGIMNPKENLNDSEYGTDYASSFFTLVLALDSGGLKYLSGAYGK